MSIVCACVYDTQGRLVLPDRHRIGRAKTSLDLDTGGSATFDRDHVHVHVVTASGLTADQARERVTNQLSRFLERAENVVGYRKLALRETAGFIPCNGNRTITCEILYAVESSRARHRRVSVGSLHG